MKKEESLLLIIDVQEHLAPMQESPREVISGCASLLDAAKKMNVPYIIAEQCRKTFGQTMIDLRIVLGDKGQYFEKDTFSCYKNEIIRQEIEKSGRRQIIIAGLETHICVLQTAVDLHEAGYDVFVVADGCSARSGMQNALGVQRLLQEGVHVVTLEMVMFEWLEKSGSPIFSELWGRRS